jgi:hypothetical protein
MNNCKIKFKKLKKLKNLINLNNLKYLLNLIWIIAIIKNKIITKLSNKDKRNLSYLLNKYQNLSKNRKNSNQQLLFLKRKKIVIWLQKKNHKSHQTQINQNLFLINLIIKSLHKDLKRKMIQSLKIQIKYIEALKM